MMKSWTFFSIIFILTFTGACSRNPLGEYLTQTIVNMGFRLSHTCVTSLNQDVTFNCSIQTDDATLTDLVWTLEPNTTCAWAGINAATGEVTGTPNDDNVGTCVIEVGSRNTMRRALNMPITNSRYIDFNFSEIERSRRRVTCVRFEIQFYFGFSQSSQQRSVGTMRSGIGRSPQVQFNSYSR